ncbi:hypothetical protein AU184_15305 [Mycolicibacterium novocastrense]|uniref:glycosyltransferase n=1 Tax=Mycolicibacterium novocastrense TaxID=59813 RepID=UPI000746DE7C|nr:glycosyltransferase [Mycolicibacterium novocastrense]KUH75758.1 hypothetical protein AU183_00325 [Mycolicibacterium novocastrense]KUH78319.1 hypothetical protein AU072_10385 [Mycolicibacterium novocastrense]KUH79654.1 hypothetical protein AU184_15305 [Mycolicibacterium novocastrense]
MEFAFACYGSRGDVEPSLAVGSELQRRGHTVRLAVPPDLMGFVESAGVAAVPYGPVVNDLLNAEFVRNFWTNFLRNPVRSVQQIWAPLIRDWEDTSATLKSLAKGVDVLSTGINFEQAAANVAEHYDIPLVALHHFPMRANGQLIPFLPSPLVRWGGAASEWMFWRATREVEDEQRRELGLPRATAPSPHRFAARGSLEIQAYDDACVPGLAREWDSTVSRRPFVGALTLELESEVDEEVRSWIADGSPPICFATGSIPVTSPADLVRMIATVCGQLNERALVCFGGTDYAAVPDSRNVKVVGPVNYAKVFPACRAVVHHGGSGTTAASLRAGAPTVILWSSADQPYWGNQVRRLKVGTSRRFSAISRKSLLADLRRVLTPQYAIRARGLASRMIPPATSLHNAADLYEEAARRGCATS